MSSAKVTSPAARLLRQSRLFSMPNPIPPPTSSIFNQSAISPYPVVQAITTSDASKHRGDWGLKRNLPLKTKVNNIAYTELDTMEHYTPFSSAENEVLLVKKWQEMDLPLAKQSVNRFTPRSPGAGGIPHNVTGHQHFISAFELEMLEEQAKANKEELSFIDKKRANWDFKGPYLGKMSPGRLKAWMEVRSNDATLRDFLFFSSLRLKEYAAEDKENCSTEESPCFRPRDSPPTRTQVLASLTAKNGGIEPKNYEETPEYKEADEYAKMKDTFCKSLEGQDATNHQIFHYLRANTNILELLVNAYFDIPTLPTGRTHPSAGLFYARSGSYMEYKPGVGGDLSTKSIPGRILYTRRSTGAQPGVAGVGGVVARTDANPMYTNSRLDDLEDIESIEHFQPNLDPYIDGDGAIQLKVNIIKTGGPDNGFEALGTPRGARHQQAIEYKTMKYASDYAKGNELLDSVRGSSQALSSSYGPRRM